MSLSCPLSAAMSVSLPKIVRARHRKKVRYTIDVSISAPQKKQAMSSDGVSSKRRSISFLFNLGIGFAVNTLSILDSAKTRNLQISENNFKVLVQGTKICRRQRHILSLILNRVLTSRNYSIQNVSSTTTAPFSKLLCEALDSGRRKHSACGKQNRIRKEIWQCA